MRILIVAATRMELAPLSSMLAIPNERAVTASTRCGPHDVDVLVSGIGMVATACRASEALTRSRFDLALNFGVCGSFDRRFAPGAVLHVIADCVCELGAEDGDNFLTLHELNLQRTDEFPLRGGMLINDRPPDNAALAGLPAVSGITVNTVHGNDASIARVTARFGPQVESMEGAAFMYSCLIAGVPFAQVRAVSNVVERRNRERWKLREAIDALGQTAGVILGSL